MASTDVFHQLKALRKQLEDKIDDLESERDRLRKELHDLETLACPKDEFVQEAGELVDALAQRARDQFHTYFTERFRVSTFGGSAASPLTERLNYERFSLFTDPNAPGIESLLYFVAGPQIKQAVTEAFAALPYPERVGPPHAERPARVQALQKQIEEKNQMIKTLLGQADEAGIAF